MKSARALALGVLAWLLVVTLGSTLVWAVISRAGQEVVATSEPVFGTSAPAGPRPGSTLSSPGSPSASSSRGGSHGGSSSPATPSSAPSNPSTSASPASPPSSTDAVVQRRTWEGPGGLVVAECRGTTMSLVAAQPDAGYAVEVGDRGPEHLEVEFEGREDDDGKHTHLVARCVSGVPEFDVTTEGSGDDD